MSKSWKRSRHCLPVPYFTGCKPLLREVKWLRWGEWVCVCVCVCVCVPAGAGEELMRESLKRNPVTFFSPLCSQHWENTSMDSWKCSKILDSAKEINGQLCYRRLIICFIAFELLSLSLRLWCLSIFLWLKVKKKKDKMKLKPRLYDYWATDVKNLWMDSCKKANMVF